MEYKHNMTKTFLSVAVNQGVPSGALITLGHFKIPSTEGRLSTGK